MNFRFLTILFFCTAYLNVFSQDEVKYFPDDISIAPFKANILEPRLGFSPMLGKNEIRLDVGNSRDLYRNRSGNYLFSAGAELFTFTKLRGEKDFHFPVDAVDYLFGMNFGFIYTLDGTKYGVRSRLSHISAHFVDGHYDGPSASWRDGRNPRVYSREFVEFLPFIEKPDKRVYLGFTYLFHVVPRDLGKLIVQGGLEHDFTFLSFYGIQPYAAVDLKLQKIGKYSLTKNGVLGVKLGQYYGPGVSIYLGYFNGMSLHGEYYDYRESYFSWGFNIDL